MFGQMVIASEKGKGASITIPILKMGVACNN